MVIGSATYGLLLITHNIMALIFTPVAIAYIIFLYFINPKNKITTLFYNFSNIVLGMMVSAFFWLPAIIEKKFVQVKWLLTGYLNYHNHFAYLDQLIYSPWGYGRSEIGRADTMSYQVGVIHLILSIASIFIIKKVLKKSKTSGAHVIFFLAITPIILFFISAHSLFLWENLPLLKYVQFSWRFLSLIILIVSFLCGSIFFVIKKKKTKRIAFVVVTALIILVNLPYCKSKWYFEYINDELTLPMTYVNNPKISALSHYLSDFTPIGVKEVPRHPSPGQLKVLEGTVSITPLEQKATVHRFLIQGETDSKLRFHMFYFPGWEVYVDDKNTKIDLTNENGLFDFLVPQGTHEIIIKFSHTPLRSTAIFISLFTLIILIILLAIGLLNYQKNKRSANVIRGPPEESLYELKRSNARNKFFLPICLFVGSFGLYLKTLCPSVYGGDTGEILSAIANLGIAHPTGFPLYMLMGKLFSLIIPFGDTAYRVNILSALFCFHDSCYYLRYSEKTNR